MPKENLVYMGQMSNKDLAHFCFEIKKSICKSTQRVIETGTCSFCRGQHKDLKNCFSKNILSAATFTDRK